MRITCFGDSICYGDGVRADKSWVALVTEMLRDIPDCSVHNAGVNGETAADGLERLPGLMRPEVPDILYVQFGLNDMGHGVPVEDSIAAMRDIVEQSLTYGVSKLIVSTNHPVCLTEEQQHYGGAVFRDRVGRFNAALRETFALPPERMTFVDMERKWEAVGGPEELERLVQADGVHLNEAGNRLYAGCLEPVFRASVFGLADM